MTATAYERLDLRLRQYLPRRPVLPAYETLDVSYLGSAILELAGLPLSDSHRERMRLMRLCQGRYYSCAKREEILRFHRRLIDSGVVAAH